MGTNYEYRDDAGNVLHIGKSSAGWVFMLRVYPEIGINTFEDWRRLFRQGGVITSEYGTPISILDMEHDICNRRWMHSRNWSEEDYNINYAMPGPNNLLRGVPRPGKNWHGEGTWDYCNYEFC